ncbi:class I poly(R)-hydroxyalkanoic acid synthase [Phenylobacterium sp. J426]|uniref:class I poly(R)-hydroxyalkanoic acid synthase n=1 Tax=Phenylobacterium sp. J426 TaxID=2898439 RepID=UPI002150A436|nr:class I poly(R)-hydroxyalkanoic acid synthase [Phenylobacterium sp. J426]MCR5875739.1 class I poly(R)-hydroxyalkanoic acid synthase [Phenylobacterium sp. J426]
MSEETTVKSGKGKLKKPPLPEENLAEALAPAPPPTAAENPQPSFDAMEFTAEQREQLEKLSGNLARAALAAQGAIAEMALRQADRPAALSPDPFNVTPALTQVMNRLAAQPDRLMRAQADLFSRYLELWQSAARRVSGEAVDPVVQPAKGDKRFADPDWSENPVFDVIKQSYLLTSNWLNGLVSEVDGVDPLEKRRVEFFMKMLTDAFSPSNFLASNPAALKEVMATGGESLVKGMENFAADLARGGGQLSIAQTDYDLFKIGENVATAPGKVVFRNEIIELIQYAPTTEQVHEIPLVIFPPWINKFYILDLRPENSMIRWLADQGITVFVASWVNPTPELSTKTFEDYMRQGIYEGAAAAIEQCGVSHVNAVGYCIGGTLLSATLAHMAAKGVQPIGAATFFAAQQDFSEAGDLLLFTNEDWLKTLEQKMDEGGGVLSGQAMADTFNALRANDLIWSFFVNNYLLGREPKPFDLLFWNSDQTRMPKTLHLFYLRRFYGDNALAKGELVLDGVKLNLGDVKIPIYVQSSKEDHIAPARSVYKGARLFGGPVTFTMAGSGHIAGVINAPAANKYQHWTRDDLPESLEAWQAGAREAAGSWWPHWVAWLKAKSGGLIPARDPAKGKLKPLGDAPGEYVKVRS